MLLLLGMAIALVGMIMALSDNLVLGIFLAFVGMWIFMPGFVSLFQ
jgi:hypothetical protein